MRGALRSLFHCRRGAAAVEFAIISMVFISVLVGVVDIGRTLYAKNQLSFLADQAARTVMLNPATTDASIETTIKADFSAGDSEQLNLTFANETVGGEDFRVLTISYPMTLFIPNLTSKTLQLDVMRRIPTT